jgi:nucleoside-diphosphate-sugar epimerase
VRYLVTGGAGFIGSHIVQALLAEGHFVRVLDNFDTGKRENLAFLNHLRSDRYDLLEGDLRDIRMCRSACQGVDAVLHQAALRSVPRSVDDPSATNAVNVQGTLNILLAARDCGVKKVVSASSSSVYGGSPGLVKKEEQLPMPISPYAVSKLAGEHYCRVFSLLYGLENVSLRYFNVFGPRQDPLSQYAAVVPKFIQAALSGEALEVHGDGLQSRDFTYVSNVVRANLLAAQAPCLAGEVINVACGCAYTILDVKDGIARLLGKELKVYHTPARKGDVRHTLADLSAAGRILGYEVEVDFAEGMRRTLQAALAARQ